MNSSESASPVKSDACAADLQHTIHSRENNDRINIKRMMLPVINLFPRVFKFDHSSENSMSSLLQNMEYIKSNVGSSIHDCYEKPLKAAKLKESIHQALTWILLSYRKLPKNENPSSYLESMSDLLAMYIDMELRASKRGQEQFSIISTRIICCLYMYLEHSTEHMIDTLIKLRQMSHIFRIILDPVMMKILKSIPTRPKTEIMYVRYLLAFRLWKIINSDLIGKKQIRQTAVSLLGSPPSNLPEFLLKYILPNGSGSQIRSTQFLMKHKFDVKACCADFLKFCKGGTESGSVVEDKMNCLERVQDLHRQQMLGDIVAEESSSIKKINSSLSKEFINLESCVSQDLNNTSKKSNLPDHLSIVSINDTTNLSSNQSVKTPKPLIRRKVKKFSDIIIIDITDEDSTPKITRQKTRKSIPWLKKIEKQSLQLNSEKKEKRENSTLKMDSPAKEILESLILVTEDSEQKKTELNLHSSFDSWITFDNLEPTSDICKFFCDEVDETNNSPPPLNIKPISTEEPPTSFSPTFCASELSCSSSVLKNNRLNSHDSDSPLEVTGDKLLKDVAESDSVIKHRPNQVISQVSRLETCKTDCQSKADSMISDSNENLSDIHLVSRNVCEGISTMVLGINENNLESNIQNCSGDINMDQFSGLSETTVVSSFEKKIETTSSEIKSSEELGRDYSKAVDYTLQKDKTLTNDDSSCHPGIEKSLFAIQDSQFQENVDALSVLATVCAAQKGNSPSKMIKVKDYARLRNPSNNEMDPKAPYEFSESSIPDPINRIVNIYPEDAFDKVALQVEVISTSEGLTIENISQSSRETSNAILSGETVVLMQKSPNSNIYVINKATENKNSDDEAFEDAEKGTELSQESLGSENLSRGFMVKTEVEEKILRTGSVEDLKKSFSTDVNVTKDKRKNLSNVNLSCRQNVKQEYSVSSHINCACGIPECSMLSHDHPNPQIPLHISATHSAALPALYGNFSSTPELCVPYRKHCSTVARGLSVNPPSTLHSHTPTNSACGRSHCSCLSCTYEVVTHYRQCIRPASEPHSSYIDGNSYFIPQHSSVQTSAVQEHERTKSDSRIANLYEDQFLCRIEQNLLDGKPLEDISIKFNPEVKYQVESNNKLPLKKRLKAFSVMQKPYDLSIKMEKPNNYPGTPMMSIANLEVQADSSVLTPPEIGAMVELTTAKEDSSPIENRHHSGEVIRRDYRKDGVLIHHHGMEKIRESSKDQRRLVNSQLSNVPHYHDSRYQRDIKTSMPRKEVGVSSLKRLSVAPSSQEKPAKKAKKLSSRQTRSSQRNVPKVNYNYTEVDPEWNSSGDVKRRRKKSSR